jgi:RND family efflux transporter MFP subunit
MKSIVRFLVIAILVAGLAGGGYWYYRNRNAAPASSVSASYTQLVTVQRGNLSSTVTVVGQLEAAQSADLAFDLLAGATKLLSLTVKPGNTVTAGQELATIDPTPYRQALDQATNDLAAAEQALADLETPPTALQITQADLAIAKAEVQLRQARFDLQNVNAPDLDGLRNAVADAQDTLSLSQLQATLAEHTSIAKTERDLHYNTQWWQRRVAQLLELEKEHEANLEQMKEREKGQTLLAGLEPDLARIHAQRELSRQAAAAEIARNQVALAEAEAALAAAQAGSSTSTAAALALAQAQVAVQEAQVALLSAQDARTQLAAGADPAALAAATASVDKLRRTRDDAQAALAATTLRAPFAATVLQTHANPGDQITAATAILALANLKSLQVVAAIDEITIRRIAQGQTVNITFDAFPGQRFRGQVLSVPLQGALQGGVMVYDVPISLTGADKLPLLVGMTANAQVQVAQTTDALLVPTMALQRAAGQYQVWVPDAADPQGPPRAVPVEVGLSDGIHTQITSGLQPGDQIVVQMDATQATASSNPVAPGGQSSLMGLFRQFTRSVRR